MRNNWAFQWKTSFNPEANKQTKEVSFRWKLNGLAHPPLVFNIVNVTQLKLIES